MKVSLNLLRYYQGHYNWAGDPAPDGIDTLLERIGAQLAGVEEIIRVGGKYKGILIVKVIECAKHENSDHLNVCLIDDGGVTADIERTDKGLIQVVCGAPNVRAGLTVAWLPPGSTVPSSIDAGEPFILGARELRGKVSNGMIASARELAIGDDHDGILEIMEDIKPGTSFEEYFGYKDDVIIDMENKMFTHRPDCFGLIGIAREIAGIQGQKFTSPEWYRADAQAPAAGGQPLDLEVRNEIPELVSRFVAIPIAGVTIKASPVWLQTSLSRLGIRPINNIVDLTNYYMLLTGQPLHAYDYDKVVAQDTGADKATIVVRKPSSGEKLALLNGKTIEPAGDTILIASATKAIGLGGVMGGGETEVDDNTKNIILECATFDMYSIRRTSMEYGVFTDAVARFNKGQSPLQNLAVTAKITADILEIAGGTVAGPAIDNNHVIEDVKNRNALHPEVNVSTKFINERLGSQLSTDDIRVLLENVEFTVSTDGDELTVKAPFWRTDIEIPEDIVEEAGRLYGYDKLPLVLPVRDLTPAENNKRFELNRLVRDRLARAGANEVLTYSFVHGDLLKKVGQNPDQAFKLSNALSPDLHYYRLSLAPSLLEKVHPNARSGNSEFALFEIGKAHIAGTDDDEGLPAEYSRVAFVYANTGKSENGRGAAFYQARESLVYLLDGLGIDQSRITFVPLSPDDPDVATTYYEPGRAATVKAGDTIIGRIGEYKVSVRKALKLPESCAGFELGLGQLQDLAGASPYIPQSRYPEVWQDICLRVPTGLAYGEVYTFVGETINAEKPEDARFTLTPVDIYARPDDTDHKQVTLRLTIQSYEKTLTDNEVAGILDKVAAAAAEKLQAERI
jgi:phenylalanyl-tRNA synthetase beta chain